MEHLALDRTALECRRGPRARAGRDVRREARSGSPADSTSSRSPTSEQTPSSTHRTPSSSSIATSSSTNSGLPPDAAASRPSTAAVGGAEQRRQQGVDVLSSERLERHGDAQSGRCSASSGRARQRSRIGAAPIAAGKPASRSSRVGLRPLDVVDDHEERPVGGAGGEEVAYGRRGLRRRRGPIREPEQLGDPRPRPSVPPVRPRQMTRSVGVPRPGRARP